MPNTIRLHRVLATNRDKVYRAFIEADALAKWLPPNGFAWNGDAALKSKVGGTFKMNPSGIFTTGNSHAFGGEYLELVPGERLRSHGENRRPQPARRNGSNCDADQSVGRYS